ncbi:MAG: leucine-rich repeat domain-containing protein [Oscillospiraceae bacterium]|nr:leucine-rich repeat domain-containing protein [Oscillospiraceae bacterium]
MKRALKILLPLVLIAVLIASAVWYLTVYDRDFTRDMLLNQARKSEASGYHKLGEWFYDLAYNFSSQDEDVAIELARQYEKDGNYTKAEYTLYQAISDGGSAKLYAERSRIFVAQDKLMDSVNMLDSISDSAIRAELNAMRPMVPSTNYDPSVLYNEYISIELSAPSGKIYATTDGSYPSLESGALTEPIPLSAGETVIYAVTVGENGLVSPLAVYSYTIGGIIEPVTFSDPAVEQSLRTQLGLVDRPYVYTDELWAVEEFTMPADATSYADLQYLPYLTKLTIENGISEELGYIAGLKAIQELHITDTTLSEKDFAAIATLPELTKLTLVNCGRPSIAPLSAAHNLEYLDYRYNSLQDLGPLVGCPNLKELYLSHNAIMDLSPLSGLTQLQVLEVSNNAISVIDPICILPSLEVLNVSANNISSLGNIGDLSQLRYLDCQNNNITALFADGLPGSPDSGLEKCLQLEHLNIANNNVLDILPLSALTKLTYLDFSHNQVPELPQFSKQLPLVTIDGSYNMLLSLEPLSGLPYLNNVFMDHNEEIETVEPLENCPMLVKVKVFGTKVTEVKFLTDMGIVVEYDPTQK